MKKYVTKKNVIIVIALVVLLLIISAVRGGNKDLTQGEVISNLSKLTLLPDVNTDTPVIAKIEVTDNIKKQFFFRDVKEGDISVLFLKNAKALFIDQVLIAL